MAVGGTTPGYIQELVVIVQFSDEMLSSTVRACVIETLNWR